MHSVFKIIISVGLILCALYFLELKSIVEILAEGDPVFIFFAVIINLLSFAIMAFRWYSLLSSEIRSSFLTQLTLYFKSTFLNTFTPANIGADAYRIFVLKGHSTSTHRIICLILRERILGLYGLMSLFLVTYLLILLFEDSSTITLDSPYVYGSILAVFTLSLQYLTYPLGKRFAKLALNVFGKKHYTFFENWIQKLQDLISFKRTFVLMLLTTLGILMWVLSIKTITLSLGLTVPTLHLAVVASLVELVRFIPITLQGIGLREGTFAYLLSFLGHNPEQSYAIALVAYLALSVSIFLCGPIGQFLNILKTNKTIK